jgi:hypothetical protein
MQADTRFMISRQVARMLRSGSCVEGTEYEPGSSQIYYKAAYYFPMALGVT